MRVADSGLAIFIFLCSFQTVMSQWEAFHSMNHLQDPDRMLQYHLDRMRVDMHPGSVIPDNLHSRNQIMRFRDFVTVENPPTRVKSNYTLQLKYQCSQPTVIVLFVEGNYLRLKEPNVNKSLPLFKDADVVFFRKYWPCDRSPVESKLQLPLIFPQELLQRPNVVLPKVWTMKDVTLKVAMVDKELWAYFQDAEYKFRDLYHIAFDKAHKSLVIPLKFEHPYSRSKRTFGRSLTWPFQIYNSLLQKSPPQSMPDDTVVELLNHPVVSSSQSFGLPRNFLPFRNREVYSTNLSKDPRFTLSFVIYVASKCEELCAISQHVNDDDKYSSPIVFLTDKGQINVQMKLANNNSYLIFTDWSVPIRQWVRIDIQQYSIMTNVTLRYGKDFAEYKNTVKSFHLPTAQLDYTDGFFTVGSSLFARSFRGIIASATMWRNMVVTSEEIKPPPPEHEMFSMGVEDVVQKYDEVEKMVNRRWSFLKSEVMNQTDNTKIDICLPYFIELIQPPKKEILNQCPLDSQPLPNRYRHIESQLVKLSKKKKKKKKHQSLDKMVGDRLYAKAGRLLNEQGRVTRMESVIAVLENASSLMHGPSCFLLYVIFENGFGVDCDRIKAKRYLYAGALNGDKMSIKTLAYKYLEGNDGFPHDEDIALYYYINAAVAAQFDRQNHEEGMTEVNRVRLTDEGQMKQQTAEDEDLFQWFKHQAGSGVQHARRNLGQLLYWGKQGLKRNLKAAFEYYEQAAQNTDDPSALYDYGITLMKGHGTEVDEQRAVEVLHQAAEKNSPKAYNTLGWHYIRQEGQKEKAVEYFEKAHELNNIDATYNLGHMHHIGDYPGKKRDVKMAFQLYYKAATHGHVESCVRISYLFACGIRGYLYRSVRRACLWAKPVTELSPVMGELVREGLQAFRSRLWTKSTLFYLAAAETGFETAGYNTAFLCDEDKSKEIRANVRKDCIWRFWNISAHHYIPSPYALNKMGDFHYYGIRDKPDLDEAIKYYTKACQMNDPQALFNMASILEEHGDQVNNETLQLLGLSEQALKRRDDAILELYEMCSNLNSEENAMPCYMGFLRMKCIVIWKYSSFYTKAAATLFAIGAGALLIFASTLLRHQRQIDALVLTELGSVEDTTDTAINTRIIQEETIEHEVTREQTRSESNRSAENGAGRNNVTDEDEVFDGDALNSEANAEKNGKALLEESTDDETELVESQAHNGMIYAINARPSTLEEDAETGEAKKSI